MARGRDRFAQWERENRQRGRDRYDQWVSQNVDLEGLGKQIASRTETWLKNHDQYLNNFNSRYSTRNGSYQDEYVADSGKWLETISQQKANFDQEAKNILQILDNYGSHFNQQWVNSIRKALGGAAQQQGKIVQAATGDRDFWGQFADAGQYKLWQTQEGYKNKYAGMSYAELQKALAGLEAGQERDWLESNQYGILQGNRDFSQKAASGWEKFQADQDAKAQAQAQAQEKETFWDKMGRWLGSTPDTSISLGGVADISHSLAADTSYQRPSSNWTEEQNAMYGYLYGIDKKAAAAYAHQTNEANNQAENAQKVAAIEDWATKNGWTGAAATIGAIAMMPLSLADTLSALTEYNGRGFVSTPSTPMPGQVSQAITGAIATTLNEKSGTLSEKIPVIGGKGLGDAYQIGTSIAQSMISGYTQGGLGTYMVFFGSASSSAMYDAKNRGATDEQAITLGILNGLAEAAGEAFSVEKLLSLGGVDELSSFFGNVLLQAGIEASEEGVTTLLNNFSEQIVMGDKSTYNILVQQYISEGMPEDEAKKKAWKNMANDLAFDMLSGAISGGVSSGIQTGVQTVISNNNAQKTYGDHADALVGEALEIDPGNTFAQKMQGRLDSGKNLSGGQLNKLVQQNERTMTDQDMASIQSAAAQRLTELGVTENVDAIAQALAKQAAGQEMSWSEKRLVKQYDVVAGELEGRFDAEWTGRIGTKIINADEYSRLIKMSEAEQAAAERADAQVSQVEAETKDTEYDGVAKQKSTGESMVLQNIASVDGGKVMVQTDKGQVPLADVAFEDADTEMLWRTTMTANGMTAEGANGIIKAYDGKVPVATYLHGALAEYRNGLNNIASGDGMASKLTKVQREVIYSLAQKARQAKANEAKNLPKASAKMPSSKNGVHFERNGRKFDAVRETSLKTMEQLHKILGVEFTVFESFEKDGKRYWINEDGKELPAPNGFYVDGMIYIDLNAGNTGKGTMLFTVAHELTHYIKEWSPKKFQVLSDFLLEQYGKKGISVNELVDRQLVKAEMAGRKLSWDEALEEVVADSMETMLSSGNAMQMMQQLKQKDKTLWERIADWFREFAEDLKKLVEAYKGVDPDSREGQLVADMQDVIGTLEQLYAEALVEAGDNAAGAEKNTTREGGEKMQLRSADGNPVVWISENILQKNNGKPVHQFIAEYIAEHIGDVYTIIESGQKVYIGEDLPGEYTQSKYTQEILNKKANILKAKNRAAANLGEMIEIATNRRWEKTKHTDSKDAKYGMYRYDTRFGFPVRNHQGEIVRANVYRAELLIRNASDGKKYLYDVVSIKKDIASSDWLTQRVTSAAGKPAGQKGDVFNNNVAQNEEIVNRESIEAMDLEVDTATESVAPSVMYSERTWSESDYVQEREKAAAEIANAIGVSKKKAKDYIDSVNSIAKMIAENRSRLDYFSSPGRTSFVGNVEYGGSFDFSTLCKKRRLLTGTFTAIQKALPNTALTADEILKIRGMMKEAGLEVSCGLCYVEGSRANMGQFAKEFLRLYKQYYPDAWQPTMADVNTPDGIEWVRINHPECYEQYEYFWNHYGTLKEGDKNLFASQQKPKLYQLHTEYKGEILQKFKGDENVEEKNLNGGIRLQSFSDFEIVHLIDTMQIIMDMSRVGLAGQAYTKVPDFAWALGDTGLKINLSLIAKGVDANGKLIFDDVEGMPIAEAMKLRERYSKNVGTILVAFNDEQLMAAMADERVDFIIPFHRSQWKKSQYEAMGLPAKTKDYTYMQNEKFIKPQYHEYRGRMVKDKAANYMPNEYWDFSKSGKENAEYYLELCARNNKRPKFYKLLENNGDGSYSLKADGSTDGYWKLLIDFKMYDNKGNGSPQMPVKPVFTMDKATEMLENYKGGHSNFPVAQGIVDSFVKEYKETHKGAKFSERDVQAEKVNRMLKKENEGLKEDVSRLKELLKLQRQVTGGTKFTKTSVEAMAGHLMKQNDVKGDKKELAGLLNSFYEHFATEKELTFEGLSEAAQPAVAWLRSNNADSSAENLIRDAELLRQVYDSYWRVSTLYTVADKYQKQIDRLKGEHFQRMGNLRKTYTDKLDALRQEHKDAMRQVRKESREAIDKQYKEISSKYQESRAKNVEGRKKTEMRRKIRRTIMDLNKLFTHGTKERNVKEGMKDFVAQALASAEVLFMDNYSNESMVRYGVEVQVTAEENRLLDQTQSLLRQRDDLYSLGAIGTEGENVIAGDTAAFDERMKKSEKLDKQIAKNMALLKSVFERERARLNEATVSGVLDNLAKAYKDLGDAEETYIRFTTDETVYQFLQQLSKKMQGATVKDMTLDQLEDLHKAYKMVLTTVRNANKLFAAGKAESIDAMAEQITSDFGARNIPEGKWALRAQKLMNKLGWDYEKLYYALDRIGSESFTRLMTNLADSENTVMQDVMEAKAFLQEAVEKYGFNNWNLDKKMDREFMDATGKKFQMSLGEMMSLYAYSRRDGAWDHIEYGGFVFGKSGLDDPKPANAYKLNKEQVEAITSLLTEKQRGYVETMQKFLSETMGAKGNEVTMAMYGVELFTEKNYFPIHVSGVFKAQAQESQAKEAQGFASMRNAGFTRSQNPNAKAPFVLHSFNQVWVDHVNEMSRYHGTVLALEDIRRVMNRSTYMEATADSVSVKQRLINSYGHEALRYFDELYREANSGAARDRLEGTSRKMLSLFRKGSVAYSASVLVQQPASLVRAYAMIPKRYFGYHGYGSITIGVGKALSDKKLGLYTKAYNEMLKYAPGVTMTKEIGGFDTATGGSIRSYLMDTEKTFSQKVQTEKYGTVAGFTMAALNKLDDNAIANLPNVADKIAWIEIWNACKRETVSTTDLAPGSEAFMEAVGKRFTEVIRATQVYDSIFAKSPMLRSKSVAVQYLVSFMNEPNTTANMAEKAIRDVLKGDKSGVRTALVVAYSIVFSNVLKTLVYAMRDDDEDETYIEKYIAAFAEGMISDFNPMNYIPVARDMVSVLKGYKAERADMEVVADVAEAIRKVVANAIKNTSEMTPEELDAFDQKQTDDGWNLAASLFAVFGIPVKNVRREILGALNHAQIASDNRWKTSWQSAIDSALEGLGVKQVKTQTLYRAVIDKDTKYLDRLKKSYSSDEAFATAVRKALKAHDPRVKQAAQMRIDGNAEGYKRLFREIQAEGNFGFNDIMWAINSAENDIRNKTEPEKVESAYSGADFVEAIVDGDTKLADTMRQDMLSADMANGMTEADAEKAFVSKVTSGIRDAWNFGLIGEASEAENLLRQYAGFDEEEAAERVRYWQFQEEYPSSELSQKGVRGWYDYIEAAKIRLDDYEAWYKVIGDFETDRDEDGDIIYSAKEKGMDYIDSLELTKKQKDALYLAMGWAESGLKKAPWH